MHCADICLSATHNESARKLVMTQFEPCQYRHKSRYASVLQNRCFYTYIWLAYLVRFFERLLRQTTPKLLPLFECLPLLFLLMSLRYSVFPNMQGDFDGYFDFKTATGTFSTANPNDTIQALTTGIQGNHGIKFNASKVNTIFGSSDTVQPKTLRGYALIRYV